MKNRVLWRHYIPGNDVNAFISDVINRLSFL